MLHQNTLNFLKNLAQNNNRDWFQANRSSYDAAKADFEVFVSNLIGEIGLIQDLGPLQPKDCIFRINRDVRFSKDKSPYKLNLSAGIGPGGRGAGRVDYYLHIQPNGQSLLGGGMWNPTAAELARYRQEIDYNAHEIRDIIESEKFKSYFPVLHGESLKTAPKGYPKDHPEIDLLRRKSLFFSHSFTDQEVLSADFLQRVMEGILVLKPYCDYMNYILYQEE
ncbi:uncharacterized protein (TIGR02453 family) [Dyadobacter jejuensis]|uniref:Uncharacterized protein (TIGR02453 family) n=1 Tax=Dyadobacter jejuensis TaxID=1082580 RepID=A0A316AMV2_9BACT|nr:DUF2461 domain-containing protein [Dyadobacter jejuensis]PWJ58872.1 uncharacterized protein (TIGR02453 family) [Dyadobacter jejuensis]